MVRRTRTSRYERVLRHGVWTSCLTRTEVSLDLVPLDAQALWFAESLAADVRCEYAIECLLESRRMRAYGRMGLRP